MPWTGKLERIDPWRLRIPVGEKPGMRVPGKIFASEAMISDLASDNAVEQVANVATLPGIVGESLAMPDIHWGYGFPIGGVAAFDAEEGVLSPGGVGFDINCGVRLIRTDLTEREVRPRLRELVDTLFRLVPSGVGSKARVRLSKGDTRDVFMEGAAWAIGQGYGWKDDLEHIEHRGTMPGANPDKVSDKAVERGAPQVGSLGGGNHFLEIQRVDQIFDEATARAYGLTEPGQVCVMIHCGSRGAGHQICTDYLDRMERAAERYRIALVDRQLAATPANSREGEDYYAAMCAGANFAWTNRQLITHWVREGFHAVFQRDPEAMGMRLVYDVSHNIAKLEEHEVDGRRRKVYVHRKGATRAFAPGHPDVPPLYRAVGQPVLVPGDMGTSSYVLAGTDQAMRESFGSACHGAGRVKSRTAAAKAWRGEDVIRGLEARGIIVKAASARVAAEEAPDAYKNVSDVVDVCHGAGIGRKVARMAPIGCVKG
ncbi:MAG TPA: RtcB family protein [Candidatus Thermoplasmatota archaeon]|nr:RtcB family protein [Candidatus Thermoplasmatota archaeon]